MKAACKHRELGHPLEDLAVPKERAEHGCRICRAAGVRLATLKLRWGDKPDSPFYKAFLEGEVSEKYMTGKEKDVDFEIFDLNEVKAGSDYIDKMDPGDKEKLRTTPFTPAFGPNIKPYFTEAEGIWRVIFKIEKGQNGETYHAIVAALTTNTFIDSPEGKALVQKIPAGSVKPFTIAIQYTGPTTVNQKLLIEAFLQPDQYKQPYARSLYTGKQDCIVDNKPRATHEFVEFLKRNPKSDTQYEIHREIANLFDYKPLATILESSKAIHADGRLLPAEAMPSFLASYYLDCIMRIQKRALPEPKENCRVVLIFVRNNPTTNDGRLMDDYNLRQTIKALAATKKVSEQVPGVSPVTHVILYGDISKEAAGHLEKEYEKSPLNVLWIGTPFAKENSNGETQPIWKQFKDNIYEYMPTEIKNLGILLALKQRYGDNFASVGFRSGSLDGAAFLGIPTFSLDNTTMKRQVDAIMKREGGLVKKEVFETARVYWRNNLSPGQYLWDPTQYGIHIDVGSPEKKFERMEEVSRYMNCFVQIYLGNFNSEEFGRGDGNENNQNTSKTSGNESGEGSGSEAPRKPKAVEVLSPENGMNHLKAAVAVFLGMNDPQTRRPLWRQRLDMMEGSPKRLKEAFDAVMRISP